MQTALVTGPGSGIGRATALQLAALGFHVVAAGRHQEKIGPVVDLIANRGGTAEFLSLDLGSFASVREAATRFLRSGRPLDVLINNAGVGLGRGLTVDGFEVHFGTNHLAHFLLTHELIAAFSPEVRVVSLASAVHHRARGVDFSRVRRRALLTGYAEYGVSKLANVLFIRELARRQPRLRTYAVHPGLVDTPLIPGWVRLLARGSMLTPEQGADTVVWCATSEEVAGESGGYYQFRTRTTPSSYARDDTLAARLWDRSEEWCGLR